MNDTEMEILRTVSETYQENFQSSDPARKYLRSRGIKNRETILNFRIGYSDGRILSRFPGSATDEGRRVRKILQKIGFLHKNNQELFRNCITIPAFGHFGEVTGVYAESIDSDPKSPRIKHLPGERFGVYNASFMTERNTILCDNVPDLLAFFDSGFRTATGFCGTEFNSEHAKFLSSRMINKIYLCADPNLISKIIKLLRGFETQVLSINGESRPIDIARTHGHPADALRELFESSEPVESGATENAAFFVDFSELQKQIPDIDTEILVKFNQEITALQMAVERELRNRNI